MGVTAMYVAAAVGAGAAYTGHQDAKKARSQAEAASRQRKAEMDTILAEKSPMPSADDEAVKRAKRRALASKRGGRASTILSDANAGAVNGLGG